MVNVTFRLMLIQTIGLAALLFSFNSYGAKQRSCDAELRLDLNPRGHFPTKRVTMEKFSASGRGATANSARRDARKRARQCAGVTWSERWHTVPPNPDFIFPQCRPSAKVKNFDMSNIKCAIYDSICDLKSSQGRNLNIRDTATVYLVTDGKTQACLSGHLYCDHYSVDRCSASEREKVCGDLPHQFPEF